MPDQPRVRVCARPMPLGPRRSFCDVHGGDANQFNRPRSPRERERERESPASFEVSMAPSNERKSTKVNCVRLQRRVGAIAAGVLANGRRKTLKFFRRQSRILNERKIFDFLGSLAQNSPFRTLTAAATCRTSVPLHSLRPPVQRPIGLPIPVSCLLSPVSCLRSPAPLTPATSPGCRGAS
jgi:hypothetical protein